MSYENTLEDKLSWTLKDFSLFKIKKTIIKSNIGSGQDKV